MNDTKRMFRRTQWSGSEMMRAVLLVAVLLLPALFTVSCAGADRSVATLQEATGTVATIGNEPFVRLALQTGPGSMLVLSCDEKTKAQLLANQGRRARIQYRNVEQSPEGTIVTVLKAELIP